MVENEDPQIVFYKKYNLILGIIMLIYPGIKICLDIILKLSGRMIFLLIVILIGIVGLIISIIQRHDKFKLNSKKIFSVLIFLFIIELILSIFRIIHYG
jgi:hypothetical protein